jgi:hypothetical protein
MVITNALKITNDLGMRKIIMEIDGINLRKSLIEEELDDGKNAALS